jgi:hypothetical protein
MKHSKLPDTIPTVLHYDGANGGNHTGTDGVRDVFMLDAKHLVAGFDGLTNWEPRRRHHRHQQL